MKFKIENSWFFIFPAIKTADSRIGNIGSTAATDGHLYRLAWRILSSSNI